MSETTRQFGLGALLYLGIGLLVCGLPTSLVGDPRCDVWNHVWGYWWFAESLGNGALPLHTELLRHPEGGTLWFVDPIGATLALPLTWLAGPAVAYMAVQVLRFVFCGLAAQLLARELSQRSGLHTLVAGAIFASTPYALAELQNGISELMTLGWVPMVLWAYARALRVGGLRAWALVGLMEGLCTLGCAYYGVATALVLVPGFLALLLLRRSLDTLMGGLVGAAVAALTGLPGILMWRSTLDASDAMIRRPGDLNAALAEHNAADPLAYLIPGDFQGVDLMARYGEAFVHTSYIRWSVLALAAWGVWRLGARWWAAASLLSLVLALGSFLFVGGSFVLVGGYQLQLPYGALQQLIPELALTHPVRLMVPALAILAALAASALQDRRLVVAAVAVVLVESAFGGLVGWDLLRSPKEIPTVYEGVTGPVLDLPAQVDPTMQTSMYAYFQTGHSQPIPYVPDVRPRGHGDERSTSEIFWHPQNMISLGANAPRRGPLTEDEVEHLRTNYAFIVLHPSLKEGLAANQEDVLTGAFGAPERVDGRLRWALR